MQPIIICGAGTRGNFAYWDLFQNYDVVAFVDIKNDMQLMTLRTGVPFYPIEALKNVSRLVSIVVAEDDESERAQVIEILDQMGFENIFLYDPLEYMNEKFVESLMIQRRDAVINELLENRSIDLGRFLSTFEKISLKEMTLRCWGDSLPLDYAFICSIARRYNCRKYLEIGTYIGESINILTDICDELHSVTPPPGSKNSMKDFCINTNVPDYSERLTYSPKIIHHYCDDSKTFDFNTIPRDIDLYFIDGDHSFHGVYIDTKNIFAHRRKDSIVIWHDFKNVIPTFTNEIAWAVKSAIGEEEFKNVFCVDTNMCGIYLPKEFQKDFAFRKYEYTEEPQDLYCYNLKLEVVKR